MLVQQDSWYWPNRESRLLHIYLPNWYYDSDERFPVTYFFDGNDLFYDEYSSYGRSWRLHRFLDRWEKPMIVVGLGCSDNDTERIQEYSPYSKRSFGQEIQGLGEQTIQWIEHDVKPAIDAQFRTWPHREATGIIGSSLGGLMSLYATICHNNTFGKAGALSTGIRFNRRNLLRDLNVCGVSPDTRVFMSWGEHEAGRIYAQGDTAESRATWQLAHMLESRGTAVMTQYVRGGRHRNSDWERQVPRMMDFLWLDRRW